MFLVDAGLFGFLVLSRRSVGPHDGLELPLSSIISLNIDVWVAGFDKPIESFEHLLTPLALVIGCILMSSSFQFAQFIVARIFLGLGTGGIIATGTEILGEHILRFLLFLSSL